MSSLATCRRCARLCAHLDKVRVSEPDAHCAPVSSWGRADARLLVVGLAPGPRGANRSGRPFVGDSSGRTLFAALHAAGLATSVQPQRARLNGVALTNVVKCLPPGNRPTAAEIANCDPWLRLELERHCHPRVRQPRAILALGSVAYTTLLKALDVDGPRFAHNIKVDVDPRRSLFASFHPSQQNVNTGRLTPKMLQQVVCRAAAHVGLPRKQRTH